MKRLARNTLSCDSLPPACFNSAQHYSYSSGTEDPLCERSDFCKAFTKQLSARLPKWHRTP